MKKVLLSLAVLTTATLTAYARGGSFSYGFETDYASKDTTNWGAYPESSFNWQATDARTGNYALSVTTTGTANRWERVIAFKDIEMSENSSYRVRFYAKGTGNINVALMQGDWNADMPLLTGNGESYTQQVYDATISDAGNYQPVSFVFYHPSEEIQNKFYSNFHTDTEKAAGEFLRLSFTGEGQYLVDNISITPSTVESIVYNGDAIRVKFGYPTNAAELAKNAGGTLVLDNSCITLQVTTENTTSDVTPESVELKSDGMLYIFLDENYFLDETSIVTVMQFTNPGNLIYSSTTAPECWTNPNCKVYDFSYEEALFDAEFQAESVVYEEAEMISSTPENESFEVDNSICDFSFTFNKPVWANAPENGKPIAKLTGNGIEEDLVLEEFEDTKTTLNFHRAEGAAALAKGTYTITVDNVANEKDVVNTTPFEITIEVGKVSVSETTYTEVLSVVFPDATDGQIPAGWTVNNMGEIRTAGTGYGSGPRTFSWTNSTVDKAFMFRTTAEDGIGYATYGDSADYQLVIPAGDVELRAILGGWDNTGFNVEVSIIDIDTADSVVVASEKFAITKVIGNTRENQEFQQEKIRFTSDGGKYIFKVQVIATGGYQQAVCGGFKVYTYTETQGEKADSEVIFADDFTTYTNNYSPAEGSGWTAYYGGAARAAGANFNYNGSRVFTGLSAKNLTAGYYENGNYGGNGSDNPSNYLIYGEGDGNTPLALGNQKYQFTYYGANWKNDDYRLLYFQLINAETSEVVYSRCDSLFAKLNSQRTTDVDADKVQFTYTPDAGNYYLKFWTNNEAIFGNIKIETLGSLAVRYRNLLKEAVDEAKAELETANANEAFAGDTRDALAAAIEKYSNPDLHTAAAYNAAIAELEALVKSMVARRANVTTYATALTQLQEVLGNCVDTKYTGLAAYTEGVKLNETYENVSSSSLSDDELASAVTAISDTYNLLNNMVNTGVTLLTQQAVELASIIINNDETLSENEVVLAADNALTDDSVLVSKLKVAALASIYKKIADGYAFTSYDAEYDMTMPDSIDISAFINNRQFYCTSTDYTAIPANYPGWNISLISGNLVSGWSPSWDKYAGTPTNPIVDAKVKNGWGDTEIDVAQTVTLPYGVYTYTIGICDRSRATWTDGANVFSDTTMTTVYFNNDTILANLSNMGQWYGETTTVMTGKQGYSDGNGNAYTATIGARLKTYQATGSVDNATLYLTAKDSKFDYAAAASALKTQFEGMTGIQTARTDAPVQTQYYNLNGQIGKQAGINIKVERYADGYTVVKKVLVK